MVSHTRKHQRRLMRALARSRNTPLLTDVMNNPSKQAYLTLNLGKSPLLIYFIDDEKTDT